MSSSTIQIEGIQLPESKLTRDQKKIFGPKPISGWGKGALIKAKARYDDECGNGHNTFAITGEIYIPGRRDIEAGGCLHEEIARHFPFLERLIKWHLVSTDGPMHYLANTIYLAGNRDCNGKLAGEPLHFDSVIRWHGFPIEWKPRMCGAFMRWMESARGSDFELIRIDHKDSKTFSSKYTLGGAPDKWHECPFDTEREGLQFLEAMKLGYEVVKVPVSWSEGKTRELDSARHAAVWPDATEEELTSPGLRELLLARLPGLMEEFKAAMTSGPLNFEY